MHILTPFEYAHLNLHSDALRCPEGAVHLLNWLLLVGCTAVLAMTIVSDGPDIGSLLEGRI